MDRGPNPLWCGAHPYEVSFFNGTVEGPAAIDTSRGVVYLGRGDGRLYALDRATGAVLWRFVTFNPELPDDPDGGGEIVSSPLIGPDGNIHFGTWGEGNYETHAFYAVAPDSTLLWRYPSEDASLPQRIFATSALSPDGSTIYVSSFSGDDAGTPATLYAFNRSPATGLTDEQRLKWSLPLTTEGRPLQTMTLAVGQGGTIYVGGMDAQRISPVVVAVRDQGASGSPIWSPAVTELRSDSERAQFVLGIGLDERSGYTDRLYATTAYLGGPFFVNRPHGALYAVDPTSGKVEARYDPSDDVPTGAEVPPTADPDSPLVAHAPWPNPSTGPVTLAWSSDRPGELEIRIFDMLGRRVAGRRAVLAAGERHEWVWNVSAGDERSRGPAAGLYVVLARLTTPDGATTDVSTSLIRLRR